MSENNQVDKPTRKGVDIDELIAAANAAGDQSKRLSSFSSMLPSLSKIFPPLDLTALSSTILSAVASEPMVHMTERLMETLSSLNDNNTIADLIYRWEQLGEQMEADAEILSTVFNRDEYQDWPAWLLAEQASIVQVAIQIKQRALPDTLVRLRLKFFEPEVNLNEHEQVILKLTAFIQGGRRGPQPDIEAVIKVGGGWEDEKRKSRIRRRSITTYYIDMGFESDSTVTDRAKVYRDIFGDMPSREARDLWNKIKLSG